MFCSGFGCGDFPDAALAIDMSYLDNLAGFLDGQYLPRIIIHEDFFVDSTELGQCSVRIVVEEFQQVTQRCHSRHVK